MGPEGADSIDSLVHLAAVGRTTEHRQPLVRTTWTRRVRPQPP